MREYLEFLRQAVEARTPLQDSAQRQVRYVQEQERRIDLTHRLF